MSTICLATTAAERGGVWRHILDLAEGFRDRDQNVVVAIPQGASILADDLTARKFKSVSLANSMRFTADTWHLHAHKTFDPRIAVLLATRRFGASGSVILTEHLPHVPAADSKMTWDPTIPAGRRKPGAKYAKTCLKKIEFKACDSVIAVSHGSKDFLRQRYRSRTRIEVVPNGVATAGTAAPALPPRAALEVVSVGALGWRKGHDVLLAATHLAQRPWRVTIVGEGPWEEELRRQAEASPCEVVFAGYRQDASRAALDAHVACLPSRVESSPYAALEAMALARPVVAADVEGLNEVVRAGETGRLFPSENAVALARILDELADDESQRRRLGLAAFQHVDKSHSIRHMVDETLQVYCSATRRHT